jgi:hypothetical protein
MTGVGVCTVGAVSLKKLCHLDLTVDCSLRGTVAKFSYSILTLLNYSILTLLNYAILT